MREPTTADEVLAFQDLRRKDLLRYFEIVNARLRENPQNPMAYFDRHYAWEDMGELRRALDDLNKVIELAPSQGAFCARGRLYRQLGEHENALRDFRRGEAMNPKEWEEAAITLLYQADSLARLGDEANALACCARLPDKFCPPGFDGTPGGDKAAIADELRRIAAAARGRNG